MIIQITPENFEKEVLKSDKPVAMAFMIKEGCKFCDEFKPVFEQYAIDHPEIKCVVHMQDTLNSKPSTILEKYGSNSFPNWVSFKNGVRRKTNQWRGMSAAVLDEMLKFLEDMDDEELAQRKVNIGIEMAKINLDMAKMQWEMFKLKSMDNKIEEEAMRRMNVKVPNSLDMKKPIDPPEDFPLNIPTIKPEDQVPCDWCQ
jgi:thiol-disulfide isomerase/thioredoxin